MGAPDATAQAALDQSVHEVAYVGWLDLLDDPIYATTAPYAVTFSGTGDADLDGKTFSPAANGWMSVSPVQNKEGGGEEVTLTLSGLIGVDTDVMNQIGDRAKFQGRFCRLWAMMIDPTGARIGNVWSYYTGYMSTPTLSGDGSYQTITIKVESWLSFMTQATGRTWLAQPEYDADDHSAELSIAIANGTNNVGAATAATATAQAAAAMNSRWNNIF